MNLSIFAQSLTQLIIDEIVVKASPRKTRVLSQHYGFTDEDLGFIINYDIKYRMGRDNGGDE